MKEMRIAGIMEGPNGQKGVFIAIRCCGGEFRDANGNIVSPNQTCFIPAVPDELIYFCCLECGQFCKVSYGRDGYYCFEFPGLIIAYNGEEICVQGSCHCGNRNLRDVWSEEVSDVHRVDSRVPADYEFKCPCNRTYLVIVRAEEGHFHICTKGECPKLTAEGKEVNND